MSNARELATAIIDESLPGMLETLVRDFHTPDLYSNGDKLKAVELFMKAKGLLQQDKVQTLQTVEINFIGADQPYNPSAPTLTIDMQPAEVLESVVEEAAEKVPEAVVASQDDPFSNLQAMLEDV